MAVGGTDHHSGPRCEGLQMCPKTECHSGLRNISTAYTRFKDVCFFLVRHTSLELKSRQRDTKHQRKEQERANKSTLQVKVTSTLLRRAGNNMYNTERKVEWRTARRGAKRRCVTSSGLLSVRDISRTRQRGTKPMPQLDWVWSSR